MKLSQIKSRVQQLTASGKSRDDAIRQAVEESSHIGLNELRASPTAENAFRFLADKIADIGKRMRIPLPTKKPPVIRKRIIEPPAPTASPKPASPKPASPMPAEASYQPIYFPDYAAENISGEFGESVATMNWRKSLNQTPAQRDPNDRLVEEFEKQR